MSAGFKALHVPALRLSSPPSTTQGSFGRLPFCLYGRWGNAGVVTPPVVVETGHGIGPGWNLFHPPTIRRERDRRVEEIEETLLKALDKVEDASSKKQRVYAVKELKKEIAAVVTTQSDDLQFAALSGALRQAELTQLSLAAYIEKINAVVDEWRLNWLAQDRDDLETAMLMMELI